MSLAEHFSPPADGFAGCLVGRAWVPGDPGGPCVVAIREDGVFDITAAVSTTAELFDMPDPAAFVREASGPRLGALKDLVANSDEHTEMVRQLEHHVDTLEVEGQLLASGDELAAELERFLRDQSD